MHTVTLSSGPVHYLHAGTGSPLLLLHGWGGSSRYWRYTIAQLAHTHSIYALDLPGYGASPPLNEPVNAERFADLIIGFADALGLEQFDLNGHSFAASIAVYVAARWPQRVRRLILTCASTYRNERERRVVQQLHRVLALWIKLRKPWMEHKPLIYRTVVRRFFYRMPTDNTIIQDSFADFLRMDRRTALESAASAGSPNYNAFLQQVTVPTLLIGARHDAIMPAAGLPIVARLIPDCRLIWIEKCGHLPMIECPDEYNRVVRDFLTQ